jgi:hypothetical protein
MAHDLTYERAIDALIPRVKAAEITAFEAATAVCNSPPMLRAAMGVRIISARATRDEALNLLATWFRKMARA